MTSLATANRHWGASPGIKKPAAGLGGSRALGSQRQANLSVRPAWSTECSSTLRVTKRKPVSTNQHRKTKINKKEVSSC